MKTITFNLLMEILSDLVDGDFTKLGMYDGASIGTIDAAGVVVTESRTYDLKRAAQISITGNTLAVMDEFLPEKYYMDVIIIPKLQ